MSEQRHRAGSPRPTTSPQDDAVDRCGDSQAHEHRRAFRRTVKWRTGSEARISTLKRQYGWDRARLDHLDGARIWTGHGVLAHNLVKIAAITG